MTPTCDDLDVLDEWPTQVNDIRCCRGERTGFEPKHLVDAMMLSPPESQLPPQQSYVKRTLSKATSVTSPRGPASEGSSTNVFAPLTYFALTRDPTGNRISRTYRVESIN